MKNFNQILFIFSFTFLPFAINSMEDPHSNENKYNLKVDRDGEFRKDSEINIYSQTDKPNFKDIYKRFIGN